MEYAKLKQSLDTQGVTLVAVSKTKPPSAILELYTQGQRLFGENRVQELVEKHEALPKDIAWHMIGQLQKNKVKYIAGFISLIHSCDSLSLAKMINKEAKKNNRKIKVLLQIKIAKEDSKAGWSYEQLLECIEELKGLAALEVGGVMGMGTFTDELGVNEKEFQNLKHYFDALKKEHFPEDSFKNISMGMSGDYPLAIECGSTMVRIGSLLFGSR